MSAADWLTAPPPHAVLDRGPFPAQVGNIRLGTASWTEKTLVASRTFYPATANTAERRLRYYARHFPLVEVDATYYALPSAEHARAWAERTPADFAFGVKAHAALTRHPLQPLRLDKDLQRAIGRELLAKRSIYARELPSEVQGELWRRFRVGLEPLRDARKLAYLLFQMPKWFTPTRESHAYLEELPGRFPDDRVAIEFRQAGWMTEERRARTLDFLRRHGLVYVAVDEPQGTRASVPPVAAATSDELSVVRFHGRKTSAWDKPGVTTTERFGYLYRPDELREWIPRLRELAGKCRAVHALTNNCYRDYAVQNAKDLAELLST